MARVYGHFSDHIQPRHFIFLINIIFLFPAKAFHPTVHLHKTWSSRHLDTPHPCTAPQAFHLCPLTPAFAFSEKTSKSRALNELELKQIRWKQLKSKKRDKSNGRFNVEAFIKYDNYTFHTDVWTAVHVSSVHLPSAAYLVVPCKHQHLKF